MAVPFIPINTVLENDSVMLRALQPDDFQHLLHFAIHEPSIWHYSMVSGAAEDGMKNYIQIATDGLAAGHSFLFIVFYKRQGIVPAAPGFTIYCPTTKPYNWALLGMAKHFKAQGSTGIASFYCCNLPL